MFQTTNEIINEIGFFLIISNNDGLLFKIKKKYKRKTTLIKNDFST